MIFPVHAPGIKNFQLPCLITEAHVSFLLNTFLLMNCWSNPQFQQPPCNGFIRCSEVFEVLMLRQSLEGLLSCWIHVCSTEHGPADWLTIFSIEASNWWDPKEREREISATLNWHLFFSWLKTLQ